MLRSIFDVPTSKEELSSTNQGMSEIFWREVQPLRNLIDSNSISNFGNGIISIRWDLNSQTWWIPNKSYFRLRCKYTDKNGNPLQVSDDIAPSMGVAGNLFQKMQFKMANQTICSVDENMAECESYAIRQQKTGQWMRDLGTDLNMWESDRDKRKQQVSADGHLGEVVSYEGFKDVKGRVALGLGAVIAGAAGVTTALSITVEQVLTFTALNAFPLPDIREKFQIGDIIKIKLVGETFERIFYVMELLTAVTMNVAATGIDIAALGAVGEGGYELTRYRHGEKVHFIDKIGAGQLINSTVAVNAANLSTFAADVANVNRGDLQVTVTTGGNVNRRQAYLVGQIQTRRIHEAASFNTNVALVAADLPTTVLKYGNMYKEVSRVDLGYDAINTVDGTNSNAFALTTNANGGILTQAANGGATLPNVNNVYKVGDLILYESNTDTEVLRLWVSEVDPSSNGNTLRVIGSENLAGAKGVLTNGRDTVVSVFRHVQKIKESSQVNKARQVSEFEIIWKPACLPIFNQSHAVPGGCLFEIELDPYQDTFYQKRAIESANGVDLTRDLGTGTGDFRFQIVDLRFFTAQCQGPIVEKMEYYIDMNKIKCHKTSLSTSSLTTTSVDVQPSSYALALAFQDKRVGNVSYLNPGRFKIDNNEELNLSRYSIRFGGRSLPDPDFDGSYDESNNIDNLPYLYARNMLSNGAYFDNSQETLQEWRERGIYFYHPFLRSGTNKESRAYVVTNFSENFTDSDNVNLLLFENYKSVAIVKMEAGRVYSISVNDS